MAQSALVLTLAFGVFLTIVKGVGCYDVCNYSHRTLYCYGENEYCCYGGTSCCKRYLSVSGIVGIVMGSVFLIGCLITLICICKQKQKNRPNVIVQPQPQTYPGTASYMAYPGHLHQGQGHYGFNPYSTQYGMVPPPYSEAQSGQSSARTAQPGFSHPAPGFAHSDIPLPAKY